MLRDHKKTRELADAWGIPFARAYAEFVRALSNEASMSPPLQQGTPFFTRSFPENSAVDEIPETDNPKAARRAKEAHEAYLASVRDGTARTVEFDPAVPAKSAGSRLKQIFKKRGIKQADIARRLGVAPSVISRVFKHPERSRLQTIRNIADAAGIAIGELI